MGGSIRSQEMFPEGGRGGRGVQKSMVRGKKATPCTGARRGWDETELCGWEPNRLGRWGRGRQQGHLLTDHFLGPDSAAEAEERGAL